MTQWEPVTSLAHGAIELAMSVLERAGPMPRRDAMTRGGCMQAYEAGLMQTYGALPYAHRPHVMFDEEAREALLIDAFDAAVKARLIERTGEIVSGEHVYRRGQAWARVTLPTMPQGVRVVGIEDSGATVRGAYLGPGPFEFAGDDEHRAVIAVHAPKSNMPHQIRILQDCWLDLDTDSGCGAALCWLARQADASDDASAVVGPTRLMRTINNHALGKLTVTDRRFIAVMVRQVRGLVDA